MPPPSRDSVFESSKGSRDDLRDVGRYDSDDSDVVAVAFVVVLYALEFGRLRLRRGRGRGRDRDRVRPHGQDVGDRRYDQDLA